MLRCTMLFRNEIHKAIDYWLKTLNGRFSHQHARYGLPHYEPEAHKARPRSEVRCARYSRLGSVNDCHMAGAGSFLGCLASTDATCMFQIACWTGILARPISPIVPAQIDSHTLLYPRAASALGQSGPRAASGLGHMKLR